MPLDLAEALIGRAGDVWNAYGPTETTVWATMYRLSPPVEAILIGRPIANTVAHVLDKNMRQVPVGVRGELFVGGAAVANGYLNRPDLTAERFLPDAIASDSGARMYKTGDVVRLLADGNLECLGRTDNQVKVRGFRIELGEIENVLLHHAGLTEAAVTVREDNAGDARLVAYLVGKGRADVSDGDLRAFVRQTLPDHMVPHAFVWVDAMPLTPSGKIDRKALNAVIMANREATDFIEPRTDTELILAELWKEALGIGRVSIRDDFFALGGHSLLASQLLSRLRQDHGMEVSFRKIFEAPTIEQLAAVLDASVSGKEPSARISPIPHITGTESGPVSILQERLWLLEELDPAQSLTHMHPAAWDLRGALDTEIAKKALHDFVERHEIMRTSFHLSEGVRTQTVAGESVIPVSLVDLSELSEAERQRALTDHFQSQLSEAFDLGRAPLVRISLIRCGPDDTVLHTVHHGMVWAAGHSTSLSGNSPRIIPRAYQDNHRR